MRFESAAKRAGVNALVLAVGVLCGGVLRVGHCAVQLTSPCPSVLKYFEIQSVDEGSWTAEIQVSSEEDLQGVWLYVVLDKKARSLINWFGESTTTDNQEFAIRKPEYKLLAGPGVAVKIRVNYNAADVPPLIQSLRLNSRSICTADATTGSTQVSKPFISRNRPALSVAGLEEFDDDEAPTTTTTTRSAWATRRPASREQIHRTHGGGVRLVPPQNVPCGVPVKQAVPLITHGKTSIEGAWPWHVALYSRLRGPRPTYICGGSLLSRHHVLTAAHCVARPRTPRPADADAFLVHLGRTQLTRLNRGLQQRDLDHILIHPRYNHTNQRNDVAVLTLATPADYTDYVRPVCLTSDTPSRNITQELGTVVGWGFDQHNNITELLHETQMPVVDLLTCIYSEPETYAKLTSPTNFCAGFKNGTSVCNGDSGGGMFFERGAPDGNGRRWEIRGMVSFSVASRNDICNPYAYAVFTDVLKYRRWIEQHTKPPEPPSDTR